MRVDQPGSAAPEVPAWFDRAKFGIFIHWTAAAIPAFAPPRRPEYFAAFGSPDWDWEQFFRDNPGAESYWNCMSIPGSAAAEYHAEQFGDLPFEAFVEQFRSAVAAWDPEPWAELFARAGARYVVLTAKEADGFLLWPSAHRNPHRENWQSERDVVGELAAAVRARGMRFGVMYCGGMDWTFGGIPITDVETMIAAEPNTDEYVAYADAHWRELVERYRPSVLWNDWGYSSKGDAVTLSRWYAEQVPDGVMNDRFAGLVAVGTGEAAVEFGDHVGDFATTEYVCQMDLTGFADRQRARGVKWENSRPMATSWVYNRQDDDASYSSSAELIRDLVEIVARGGNLLLNVGPTGAGAIPWAQAERLLAIGWWLGTNGGAVYDTDQWDVAAATTDAGVEVRFTAGEDAVNCIVFPVAGTSRSLELPVVLEPGARVELLGVQGDLGWERVDSGIRVMLPEAPTGSPAFALRMQPRASVSAAPHLLATTGFP